MARERANPVGALAWQPSLLDAAATEPGFDETFASARRVDLDASAWVEHVPGWACGADDLFADIVETAPWEHRTVMMYGNPVKEPRLTAWYGRALTESTIPPVLRAMAEALSARYEREFDSIGAALYRDGRDSVAWHGDRIDPEIVAPVVVILSLGSRRTLRMRPKFGSRVATHSFILLPGDCFVMGGMSQRTWEHSVPKVARAGPRVSVQFRHSR